MVQPDMVMLDEPMAGVNPALTQSLLGHVKALREDGMTVLFVEHDMDMVRDISDWVVVMADFALSVLVTVISKTTGERLVVDAGCKVISGERGLPSVKGIAGLKLKALHAEHAPIDIMDPAVKVEVGDKIEIAVHYHDGTINLHRKIYGMRNGEVERIFTIEQ